MSERAQTCYDCRKTGGHAATGGIHPPWHCKPDICPDRGKHAESVYGARLTMEYGGLSRDGVTEFVCIDGKRAGLGHIQSRCICGLLLIWTPMQPKATT